jgi:ribonuclease VapC
VIVDTSALVAITREERHAEQLAQALIHGTGIIPAPVIVEFHRVTKILGNALNPVSVRLIETLKARGFTVHPFDETAAQLASAANATYGSGNGTGGKLNMLDLMVYGTAMALDLPILCTGKDFAATDVALHPASRRD